MQPILTVNLSTGELGQYQIPLEWERDYLGGASLAARLLYEKLTPDLDPLSPEAPLLFLNGPLSGTSGPTVGRFVICSRSPATGLWAESNCGGFWGPELRKAGFDGVWIQGRADRPVYLWIRDGEVDIRPATHLWGVDTYRTAEVIQAELGTGKMPVAAIGPAGEARLPFALILTDHGRVAGRTGMGAVMGAKNLKAVAVQGHGEVPVIDFERYAALRSSANRALRGEAQTVGMRELGTASAADYMDYLGEMSKRYFSHGAPIEDLRISGAALKESILAGVSACHACVIACGRVVRLEDGIKRKGPEHETLVGFGPNLGLNDPVLATRFGELCDRYGMDTISLSNTIGMAFRLFELGRITLADTGGLDLTWGNANVIERLIHLTVRREGFGSCLALGALGLGRQFGAEEEAVQVNGLEIAYHDPRGSSGMALVYATSPRGACHNQSDYFMVDLFNADCGIGMQYLDRQGGVEKAKNVAIHQDWRTLSNSLVMCVFANVEAQMVVDLINAGCGLSWSIEDALRCGERGWNLKRVINHRLGLTAANDSLPAPLLRPYQDQQPDSFVPDFASMIEAYYAARGWNSVTGYPLESKLNDLDLGFAARDIYPAVQSGR